MYRITALYHFARLDDPAALRAPLLALCESEGVRGTLLLAREGINGTISGPKEGVTRILDHLRALPGCADLAWKDSHSATPPFGRMKVRVKREIVTMG
ncbi:MAG: rhodanese-related sulfurtransferase, partial [Roseovarius sp.]